MPGDREAADRRQFVFDLGYRPAFDLHDFLVSPSNREAVEWLDRWPNWAAPALAIVGPPGSGKSHLAHVFAGQCRGRIVNASAIGDLDPPRLLEGVSDLVVEDADRGINEEAMLHLYNWVLETGGHLLLTGRQAPARWTIALPDLRSRLASVPVVNLAAPDDVLLGAVLIKTMGDRQLVVNHEVVRFVIARIERSFVAVHRFVTGIDTRALAEKRKITIPLAREVLTDIEHTKEAD
ncbi:MAG: DNA replication protein [Alphaproteobacteria bacterium]|nr:DNA replication protein [Alphaproteobacteria bacterium]